MSSLEDVADFVCEVRFRTEILAVIGLLNSVLLVVLIWLVST